MSGLVVLDVIIGIVFIFLLLSLLCSGINEWIAGLSERRGRFLKKAIDELLGGGLSDAFYKHPLIEKIFKKRPILKDRRPSVIPSHRFARVALEVIPPVQRRTALRTQQTLRDKINGIDHPDTKNAFDALLNDAEEDIDQFILNVEEWFDEAMDLVTDWYRRNSEIWLFIIGLVLAGVLNADTIMIVRHLWDNSTARAAIVAQAEATAGQSLRSLEVEVSTPEDVVEEVDDIEQLDLPIGWARDPKDPRAWPTTPEEQAVKVGGLLITAAAISVGAPVWFDALKRLVGLRAKVRPGRRKKKKQADDKRKQGEEESETE